MGWPAEQPLNETHVCPFVGGVGGVIAVQPLTLVKTFRIESPVCRLNVGSSAPCAWNQAIGFVHSAWLFPLTGPAS